MLRLGGGQSLQPCVQAALVAGDGVVVQNTLLDALVEGRNGLAVLRVGSLHVPLGDGLAQGAQAGAYAGTVGAVYLGAGYGLAGALQRRYMVCHYASLNQWVMRAGMQARPHPSQFLSLRESWRRVN